MDLNQTLPLLLGLAWLLPLASFALIVLFGPRMGKAGHVRRLRGHAGDHRRVRAVGCRRWCCGSCNIR